MGNSVRFKVLMRDGFKCAYCGKTAEEKSLEVDHVIPRSRGGSNALENLVTSCFECNRGKRDKLLIETVPEVGVSKLTEIALQAYRKQVQMEDEARIYIKYFLENAPHHHDLTKIEERLFKNYIKSFPPYMLFEAIDIAIEKYIPETATNKDYYLAIKKIGGICFNKTKQEEKEEQDG